MEPAERALALHLDALPTIIDTVTATLEPHRLAGHLYATAQAFTTFYDTCPVLKAPTTAIRDNRLALCQLTSDTLKLGLDLLGIASPHQL